MCYEVRKWDKKKSFTQTSPTTEGVLFYKFMMAKIHIFTWKHFFEKLNLKDVNYPKIFTWAVARKITKLFREVNITCITDPPQRYERQATKQARINVCQNTFHHQACKYYSTQTICVFYSHIFFLITNNKFIRVFLYIESFLFTKTRIVGPFT